MLIENNNLIVTMDAFLLTPNGSLFWNECNSEKKKKRIFKKKKNGFKRISEFGIKCVLIINCDMENIFDNHF